MRLLAWMSAAMLAITLICVAPMRAQQAMDSTKADPAHHKIEFDNDQVRVVRYRLAPGDETARHQHPDSVIVVLTGGSIRNTTEDGKVTSTQPKAGDVSWRPALTHVTKNVGATPIEGILIEPKHPHSTKPAGSADPTTIPTTRAKVVFENEQVRVLHYRFNPGEMDEMHGHPDNVQIMLTDATAMVTTPDGKTNHSEGKAGQIIWRPAMVHSVRNTGDKPFEGVLIEMKGGAKTTTQ